ncbi:MAG: efflux RND transporter periplasmic adaptor subunit [Myxococcales bacterium]
MDTTHTEHPEAMPEGEEQAPRGTRVMGVVRWLLVVAMAGVAAVSFAAYSRSTAKATLDASATLYHCPMHPAVIQDHPGDCPICGMSLVQVEKAGAPKHDQTMEKGHEGHRHEPSDPYACPMDPEETGMSAKDRCPICKMFLVPKETIPALAAKEQEKVPGLAPIELTQDRVQLAGVRTEKVTRQSLQNDLRTVGSLAASEESLAHVHTRFSGWIEQVFVMQTGDKVEKGQELATIYSPELLAAQQEFLNARRWAQQGSPNGGLEADARQKLELLGISETEIGELEKSGKPQRAMKIRSPVQGYVISRTALPGLYVQTGAELFQVADLSRVWLLADIYESEIGRVKIGQPATLTLQAYPGETFTGRVQFIYPTLNAETRTLRVRLAFKNPDLRLKPGMFGNVALQLAKAEGLVVPSEAVVDTGETQYLFLSKEGGRFEPRRVKLGARLGERTQILSGVAEGDLVVTTANFLIDSESRLRAAIEGMSAAPAPSHADHGQPKAER